MYDVYRRQFGIAHADVAQFIARWLDGVGARTQGALLSTAWMEPAHPNGHAFLVGRLLAFEERVEPRAQRIYPTVRLEEAWIERAQIVSLLDGILGDRKSALLPELFHSPNVEQVFSVHAPHTHTSFAETHLNLVCRSGRVTPEWVPAVASTLPPYRTWTDAAATWILARSVEPGVDLADSGKLMIVLPDRRARVTALTAGGGEGTIRVLVEAHAALHDLEIQYLFSRGTLALDGGAQMLDATGSVEIACREDATQLDVYCVHPQNGFISHRTFLWNDLRAVGIGAGADDRELNDAIQNGERETVEFKPFACDSEKLEEIVRTVVAFANTDGGRIFVVVDVPAGALVYSTHEHEIVVRKGSTNRRPARPELESLLRGRPSASNAPNEPIW